MITLIRSSKNTQRLFVCFAVVVVAGFLFQTKIISTENALIGMAMIAVLSVAGYIDFTHCEKSRFPFFPAVCLFYLLFFTLPLFTIPLAWQDAQSIVMYSRLNIRSINPGTLLILLGGLSAMTICYFIARYKLLSFVPRLRFSNKVSESNLSILLWILVISQIFNDLYLKTLGIPSLNQFLIPAGFVGMGGLYIYWRRGMLSFFESGVLLIVILPLEIYLRLVSLALTNVMLLAIFFSFLFWFEKRFKLFAVLACVALIIFSLYGASTSTRYLTNATMQKLMGTENNFINLTVANPDLQHLINVSNFYLKLIAEGKTYWGDDNLSPVAFSGRFASVVHRTSHLWLFHIVDDKVPNQVPLWQGETYRPLLTSFIPRVIYPNKPEERQGYSFGYRYGFIKKTDTHMSINLPWVVELLANFGRWSVIWGMALIGVFLAFLDRVFNSKEMTDLEFIVGLTIIFPLVIPESNFSLMTGSLLPLFISLYVYFAGGAWVLSKIPWLKNAA